MNIRPIDSHYDEYTALRELLRPLTEREGVPSSTEEFSRPDPARRGAFSRSVRCLVVFPNEGRIIQCHIDESGGLK